MSEAIEIYQKEVLSAIHHLRYDLVFASIHILGNEIFESLSLMGMNPLRYMFDVIRYRQDNFPIPTLELSPSIKANIIEHCLHVITGETHADEIIDFTTGLDMILPENHEWRIECVDFTDFSDPDCGCEKMIIMARYLMILNIIASQCPTLITDEMMNLAISPGIPAIVDIMIKYKREAYDKTKPNCVECHLTYPISLIQSACSCHFYIHVHCLNKRVNRCNNHCLECSESLGCVEWHSPELDHEISFRKYPIKFYPTLGIYPYPLLSIHAHCVNILSKLHLAIVYVQVDVVAQIMDAISREELEQYVRTSFELKTYKPKPQRIPAYTRSSMIKIRRNSYAIHQIKNSKLLLLDELHTGVKRCDKFEAIETILNDKIQEYKIDLN